MMRNGPYELDHNQMKTKDLIEFMEIEEGHIFSCMMCNHSTFHDFLLLA